MRREHAGHPMATAVDGWSATALEVRGVSQGERARMVQELVSQVGATAVVVCDHERELFSIGEPLSRP